MKKVLLVAVVAALSACATATENLAENAIENAIENELGGDASVEMDDDSIQIITDDGTQSIAVGEGAEVPDGFPIPVPDGGTVGYTATDSSSGGATVLFVDYPASMLEELVEAFEDHFAGLSDVSRMETSNPTLYLWSTGDGTQSVTLTSDGDSVTVQMVATG